jgi:hypothetical protein
MIEFIFRIKNPRPTNRKQKDYVVWDKRLSKNWATELQISRWSMNNYFELWINTAWTGGDHEGPSIYVELFGYMFNFKIYNVNHWNWDKGRFYTEEEARAEYEEDQQWREENGIDNDPDDKYAKWANKE